MSCDVKQKFLTGVTCVIPTLKKNFHFFYGGGKNMGSMENFVHHTFFSFFVPFDLISRDLVSIIFEYYFIQYDCSTLTFFSKKYKKKELFKIPSLFFSEISVLKPSTFAQELRDLVPAVCFRIIPYCQLYCVGSNRGSYRYCDSVLKFDQTCECRFCESHKYYKKKGYPNKILRRKIRNFERLSKICFICKFKK